MVRLISNPSDRTTFHTCTASLISPSVLLTTAHGVGDAHHLDYVFGAYLGDDASANPAADALDDRGRSRDDGGRG